MERGGVGGGRGRGEDGGGEAGGVGEGVGEGEGGGEGLDALDKGWEAGGVEEGAAVEGGEDRRLQLLRRMLVVLLGDFDDGEGVHEGVAAQVVQLLDEGGELVAHRGDGLLALGRKDL